jgi:alpha-L-rhamnosidase
VNSSLGDWDPPNGSATDSTPGQNTNVAQPTIISQSSSAYVAYEAQVTANAARALAVADPANAAAYTADAAQFDQMYANVKADYNAKFWNATDGYYEGDTTGTTFSQAAQILPLAFGLVPDGQQVPLEAKLVNDVVNTRTDHEEVGIAGARWFFPVLTQAADDGVPGAAQAAYAVALQTTYPSYGWERQLGWTGIGENWDSTTRTRDHQMFGTIGQWMYQYLAGLDSTSPGFQTVDIRPLIVPGSGINHVAATYNSDRGLFKSSWTIGGNETITMDVTIPANTTATVYVPATSPSSVTERGSGRDCRASQAPGVTQAGAVGNSIAYKVGSGDYEFVVTPH